MYYIKKDTGHLYLTTCTGLDICTDGSPVLVRLDTGSIYSDETTFGKIGATGFRKVDNVQITYDVMETVSKTLKVSS